MNETYNGVEPQKNQVAPKARTESVESLGSRSESKTSLAAKGDDKAGDLGQVKFTKNVDESAVEIGGVDVAFAGMGKEELMKYANDPFWVRLRWALFILFWLVWLAMLVIAIVIVVLAPKCPAPAPLDYWQKGVVYSVNLKSFQDGASQDGKGDIQGNLLCSGNSFEAFDETINKPFSFSRFDGPIEAFCLPWCEHGFHFTNLQNSQ